MPLSSETYTGTGIVGPYAVTFPYLDKTHVQAYLDGVLTTAFTWPTASTISFDVAVGVGVVIVFRRATPTATRLVTYQDATVLTAADLNNSDLQNFYIAQELVDNGLAGTTDGTVDAGNKRIKNLANGVNAQDAVSMAQLALAAVSPMGTVAVANGGTGATLAATARTNLGLGTAAVAATGTASGNVPVLDTNGKIASGVQSRLFQPLSAGVSTNILTLTLAPGALLEFSDGTASLLAAAIALAVPDTATLGTSNGVAARLWVVAVKNGGTPELAVINTWNGTDIFEILPTDSTTTVAMTTGADLAHTWYSTTLRAAQAIAVVGYIETTQATAGTWVTAPSVVQGWGFGVPLPGGVIQTRRQQTGALASGATPTPLDDTIPQITEGTEFLTKAITPRSALNLLDFDVVYFGTSAGAVVNQTVALHQVGVNDALAAVSHCNSGANQLETITLRHRQVAGSAAALTFTVRAGNNPGNTSYLNGDSAVRRFGGVGASGLRVTEVMR